LGGEEEDIVVEKLRAMHPSPCTFCFFLQANIVDEPSQPPQHTIVFPMVVAVMVTLSIAHVVFYPSLYRIFQSVEQKFTSKYSGCSSQCSHCIFPCISLQKSASLLSLLSRHDHVGWCGDDV
jgi:hypothetical protein